MMERLVCFVAYFPEYPPIVSLIISTAPISLPFPSTLVETLTVEPPIPADRCIQILVFPPFIYVYGARPVVGPSMIWNRMLIIYVLSPFPHLCPSLAAGSSFPNNLTFTSDSSNVSVGDFWNIANLELTSMTLIFAVPTRSISALSKVAGMVRLIAAGTHDGGSLSSAGDDRLPNSSLVTVPSDVEVTIELKDDRERETV